MMESKEEGYRGSHEMILNTCVSLPSLRPFNDLLFVGLVAKAAHIAVSPGSVCT